MLGKLNRHMQKNETRTLYCTIHTPYTQSNSKWIEDFNIKTENIKLLEVNKGGNLSDIGFFNIFVDLTPKTKQKQNKQMNYFTKSFLHSEENHHQHEKATY